MLLSQNEKVSAREIPEVATKSKEDCLVRSQSGGFLALASVPQLAEALSSKLKGYGLIPSQGTCLGCRFGPWLGCVERQLIDVFLTLMFLLFLSPCPQNR